MRRFVSALALVLAVTPAAAAGLSKDYPARGRALDTARPASDYTAEIRQRPRALSLVRTRAHGFVPSAELQDFVRSVLVRLAGGLVLPASFDPQIRILAAPDFGALCTPDGTLVISIGLLEQIESEDELAFVFGHEIAHAILRHHRSDWYARTQYF